MRQCRQAIVAEPVQRCEGSIGGGWACSVRRSRAFHHRRHRHKSVRQLRNLHVPSSPIRYSARAARLRHRTHVGRLSAAGTFHACGANWRTRAARRHTGNSACGNSSCLGRGRRQHWRARMRRLFEQVPGVRRQQGSGSRARRLEAIAGSNSGSMAFGNDDARRQERHGSCLYAGSRRSENFDGRVRLYQLLSFGRAAAPRGQPLTTPELQRGHFTTNMAA